MSPLKHAQARQWIQMAADGLLDAEKQAQLAEHLAGCAECQAYADELAGLETALSAALQAHWGAHQLDAEAVDEMVKRAQQSQSGLGSSGWWKSPPFITLGLLGLLLAILALLGVPPFLPPIDSQPTATREEEDSGLPADATASATSSATATNTVTQTATELVLVAVPQQTANCRYGNSSSQFDIADTLYEGERYTPLAKGIDLLWVYFQGPATGQGCWAFVENLDLLINNEPVAIEEVPDHLLPFMDYPPTPTPSATPSPSPTSTETPVPTPTCTPRAPTAPGPNC